MLRIGPADRWRSDRGSSLMLMPAAVLVFVVLGAFCVDFAAVHLGRRQAVVAAQGIANDAAAAAFDEAAFYRDGVIAIDEIEARQVAERSRAANAPSATVVALEVRGSPPGVRVVLAMEVETIFSKALPGGPDSMTVRVSASSDLIE